MDRRYGYRRIPEFVGLGVESSTQACLEVFFLLEEDALDFLGAMKKEKKNKTQKLKKEQNTTQDDSHKNKHTNRDKIE